jgi:hypothetical protein
MADRPELEPVAHAISYDGSTPDRLWLDGDGPLLDLEVARQGGTATKLLIYNAAQLAAEVAKARAEEGERMADMIERMTRLRRAARAALNDMPIQPCEFAAAIRQASEQANAQHNRPASAGPG